MADIWSKKKRSEVMSLIKGKNTKPELVVRSMLHRMGFRFRIHARKLPGTPDIMLPKFNAVVFVNGCFWHCHAKCGAFRIPKTNRLFWKKKLSENLIRDMLKYKALKKLGWRVFVIWECELKSNPAILSNKLSRKLRATFD